MGQAAPALSATINYSGPSTTPVEWYSSGTPSCSGSSTDTGTSGLAFYPSTAAAGTTYYCAVVFDDGVAGYASASNAVNVTVYADPTADVTPTGPLAYDAGQTASTLTAAINDSYAGPGTVSFEWYDSAVASCSASSTDTGVPGTSFTPNVAVVGTTYYCAVVFDSGLPGYASASNAVEVAVYPVLAAGPITPPAAAIDRGQSVTLTADPSGGSGSYSFQWYADAGCVVPLSRATSRTYNASSPSAAGYSYRVSDSTSASACVGSAAAVSVNPPLYITTFSAVFQPSPPAGVILTVEASGGTPPYYYQWYAGPACAGSGAISGATSQTYLASPLSTTAYSVSVTDSSQGMPAASSCMGAAVNLGTAIVLSPSTMDAGQSATFTVTVSWAGGTSPYSVTLFSGSSRSCPSDTAVVGSNADVAGLSTTFSVPAPASTTRYCAAITDSEAPPSTTTTSTAAFTVKPPLTATVALNPSIDSGQSVTLKAAASQGTSPYHYQWYTGSSCGVALPGATSNSYTTGVLASSAIYSVNVTDSSHGSPPDSVCASATVTVALPLAVTVSPSALTIDGAQSVVLEAIPTQGTAPYHYQWFAGSSCSKDPISGARSSSYTASPRSTATYSVKVTDSGSGAPAAVLCASSTITFNPATTLTISCSLDSVPVGSATTCRVTVAGSTPLGPSGYVYFYSNSTGTFSAASCQLVRHATFSTCARGFRPGAAGVTADITARYTGDASHTSSSGDFHMAVTLKASTITVSCTPTSARAGSTTVKCTAVVVGYLPTGVVTWSQSGPGTVSFSSATCTLASLRNPDGAICSVTLTGTTAGKVTLRATYGGDPNNQGSARTASLKITS